MRSRIYWGEVVHWRAAPKRHFFRYPIFTFGGDLDELSELSLAPYLMRANRWAILSVRESDYLNPEPARAGLSAALTLRERVKVVAQQAGCSEPIARVVLYTMPRYFGYVFNPVSFFVCYDLHERIVACITQVNNTFGETHLYPLVCTPRPTPCVWRFSKDFFVSPFFSREGEYCLTLEVADVEFGVRVDLFREGDGEPVFSARLTGRGKPLTWGRAVATVVRFPLTGLLTMVRIHLQALALYRWVGAAVFNRPEPDSPRTIRSQQRWIHRARLRLLAALKERRRKQGVAKGAD
jgi:cyclopropane-fatty-acyl-phospholipid synthase